MGERESHAAVAGVIVPIDEFFYVGNSIMRYPKDIEYDAGLEEIAGCRCSLKYLK